MEETLYTKKMGSGYVARCRSEEAFGNKPFTVGDEVLVPDTMTTMSGYFKIPLEYVGNKDRKLVFYIGEEVNVFGSWHYYQMVNYLTPVRLFEKFGHDYGRDFNYKNGKWK